MVQIHDATNHNQYRWRHDYSTVISRRQPSLFIFWLWQFGTTDYYTMCIRVRVHSVAVYFSNHVFSVALEAQSFIKLSIAGKILRWIVLDIASRLLARCRCCTRRSFFYHIFRCPSSLFVWIMCVRQTRVLLWWPRTSPIKQYASAFNNII